MKERIKGISFFKIRLLVVFNFLLVNFSHTQEWNEIVKLNASDAEEYDLYGNSVSIDGTTAIIGAPLNDDETSSGSAYVCTLESGVWVETIKLIASDASEGDQFGFSVAISGNIIVIGAHKEDDYGTDSGAAYIFEFIAGEWIQTQKITASDADYEDNFGNSVAISKDKIVVGAYRNTDAGDYSGAAYVFESIDDVWIETSKLTSSDLEAHDHFGLTVDIDENTIIIGAHGNDDDGVDSGSAYIFDLVDGVWVETIKLAASDALPNDQFGRVVAISGKRVVIGVQDDDDDGSSSGSAYIFDCVEEIWEETQKITASDADIEDSFGISVDVSGDNIVVGASNNDDDGLTSGSAYVFELSGDTWSEVLKLTAADAESADYFGYPVSISNNTIIIAARGNDDGGTLSGSAYIFRNCDLENIYGTVNDSEICLGDSIVFSGMGADTYEWDFGVIDGEHFIPEIEGTHTYTGTGELFGCGENSFEVSVIVNELPTVIATVDDSAVCLVDSIIFYGFGAETYEWDMGVSNGVPFASEVSGIIQFTVIGADSNGCTNRDSIEVYIGEEISIDCVVYDEVEGGDGAIDISVLGGTPLFLFDWDNDGIGDFDDDEDLTGLSAGIYEVSVMDNVGCTATKTISVHNQVGLVELVNTPFSIYPNPFNDLIVVYFQEFINESYTVVIHDNEGREIYRNERLIDSKLEIESDQLDAGIYVLSLFNSNSGRLFSVLIFKE